MATRKGECNEVSNSMSGLVCPRSNPAMTMHDLGSMSVNRSCSIRQLDHRRYPEDQRP